MSRIEDRLLRHWVTGLAGGNVNPDFGYIGFAENLVHISLVLHVLTLGFAIGGQLVRDRRWITAARNTLIFAGFTGLGAAAGLVAGFLDGAYHIAYIYDYSERELPIFFRFAGLWAGLNGSLLFWSMLVGILASYVGFQFRRERDHPAARRMEPNSTWFFPWCSSFFSPSSRLPPILSTPFRIISCKISPTVKCWMGTGSIHSW